MSKSKLIAIAVILAISAVFLAAGCKKTKSEAGSPDTEFANLLENNRYATLNSNVIEIGERMFATQINDVYLNAEDYLGKTIKLQGIFKKEQWGEPNKDYCFVVRYGPGGCCGLDANVGFEVAWADEKTQGFPDAESWVEATGVLKTYEEDFYKYLYLDLSSLNVLNRRGAETVRQ